MNMSISAAIAQFVFVGIPVVLLVWYFVGKKKKKQRSRNG